MNRRTVLRSAWVVAAGVALANLAGDWLAQRPFIATVVLVGVIVTVSVIGYLARHRNAAYA